MSGKITFKGKPMSLVGRSLKEGLKAPDFKAVSSDAQEVVLSDFSAKIKVITSFLSLDTPVCDLQVKEFNKKATGFSSEVTVIGISKDLPFAQKRFCENFDIKNVTLISDYRFSSFGINYGLLIKELNLLTRSVLILDKNDIVRYIQIVNEATSPPDYNAALNKLDEIIKSPPEPAKEEIPSKCKPCETGAAPLPKETTERLLAKYRGWESVEDRRIVKEFKFKDFVEAKYFLDLISVIAEEQGHHPSFTLIYNRLKVSLTTHAAGGLTENDFIMARLIDELGGQG